MNARQPGKARLNAELDRVPGDAAQQAAPAPRKTGVETVRTKGWQRDADADPETLVQIIDHDAADGAGRVLWSGSEADHRALAKTFRKEG